jgi:hypothetical protein
MPNHNENITLPENLDELIEKGIIKGIKRKRIKYVRKTSLSILSALILTITINLTMFSNSVMAKTILSVANNIPIINNIFNEVEDVTDYDEKLTDAAKKIDDIDGSNIVTSNGLTIGISELYCDKNTIYMTYELKKDEIFKDLPMMYNGGTKIDIVNSTVIYSFTKERKLKDFEKENLKKQGVSPIPTSLPYTLGNEIFGKKIDNSTFVGINRIDLLSLDTNDIPDNFEMEINIKKIMYEEMDKLDGKSYVDGNWKFKLNVNVDKSQITKIENEPVNEGEIGIKDITKTPFEIRFKILGEKENPLMPMVFDKNGDRINFIEIKKLEDDSLMCAFPTDDFDVSEVDILVLTFEDFANHKGDYFLDEYEEIRKEKTYKDYLMEYSLFNRILKFNE